VWPWGKRAKKKTKVLLIEDDAAQAEVLKEALQSDTVHVDLAVSGRDGLDKARSVRPDLVLCDIGLPDIGGEDVARQIRADPALQSVRLIALTAKALPEDRESVLRAGFERHIAKPPSLDLLEELVANTPTAH
jgi:CheY-like chemotaxis protein